MGGGGTEKSFSCENNCSARATASSCATAITGPISLPLVACVARDGDEEEGVALG